jgi:hypothetical protein
MPARVVAALALGAPAWAWAHAFDDRYDLPAPLSYFVIGASAVVVLSFVVAELFENLAAPAMKEPARTIALGVLLPLLRFAGGAIGLLLFALTIIAGLFGTRDPLMNLAPTMVWIVSWVGLSLLVACIGNVWPALDPWRTLFDIFDAAARHLGRAGGITLNCTYPQFLGAWPAVVLLLAIAWFEVVYPQAAVPYRLAWALIGWSALTLAGMIVFGRETWQNNADVFAIYFATLGRFGVFARAADPRSLLVRSPGSGLIGARADSAAMIAFVIAMLSTVLFDGLLGGQLWQVIQGRLARAVPLLADGNGYMIGAAGLAGVWLVFLAAYVLTCLITTWVARERALAAVARAFAFTLVPIAIAYNLAHNASNLIMQMQLLIPLASDPLGSQWNLFGTVNFRPAIGLVDARLSWFIAIGAIVGGHVVSIWLAHRVALREYGTARRAVVATIPLATLMVIYTAVSLSVIAEPMVKFDAPDAVISQ